MTAQPQRRATRQDHLDARVVPVERALLARAERLEYRAATEQLMHELPWDQLAAEFRNLAEELHWHG